MNGKKLSKEEVDRVLEQGYLYRGTNSFDFEVRKKEGFYCGRKMSDGKGTTSTSFLPLYAMIRGIDRCETSFYKQENAEPIFLAIHAEPYSDSLEKGLEHECGEMEINGKIDLKDIVVVDSLDKLKHVCPDAHSRVVEYFKENYLGQK